MTQDELLQQIDGLLDKRLKPLEEGQTQIVKRLDGLEEGQNQLNNTVSHIKTAVEALAEGQKSLATKADIQRIMVKDKEQDKRIATLEDEKGISHKN